MRNVARRASKCSSSDANVYSGKRARCGITCEKLFVYSFMPNLFRNIMSATELNGHVLKLTV